MGEPHISDHHRASYFQYKSVSRQASHSEVYPSGPYGNNSSEKRNHKNSLSYVNKLSNEPQCEVHILVCSIGLHHAYIREIAYPWPTWITSLRAWRLQYHLYQITRNAHKASSAKIRSEPYHGPFWLLQRTNSYRPSWQIQRLERRERTYGLTSEPWGNLIFRSVRVKQHSYTPLIFWNTFTLRRK